VLIDTHNAWRERPNARRLDLFLADAYPVVLRTLKRMLKGAAVHEDIAQLCMVKVAEGALFTFRATGEIENWLEVIAKNEALDYIREPHHREQLAFDPRCPDKHERVETITPEMLALDGELRRRVEAAFEVLRHDGRRQYVRVLRAYYMDGRSLKWIAEDEGLKYHHGRGKGGPAKALLHRARGFMRDALKEIK
jgi:RNA polymerase sigma factor (sigma-70 family)